MLKNKTLAVLGVGKLGEALISGLLKKGDLKPQDIVGSVAHEASIDRIKERLGISASLNNKEMVRGKDLIIVAVKPQNMDRVIREIADELTTDQVIISVAQSGDSLGQRTHEAIMNPFGDDDATRSRATLPGGKEAPSSAH